MVTCSCLTFIGFLFSGGFCALKHVQEGKGYGTVFQQTCSGDGRLDLLVCSRTNSSFSGANVTFLKRDVFLAGGGVDFIMLRNAPIILLMNETGCDMQAVDFDEDGDVDLALGDLPDASYYSFGNFGYHTHRLRKYFERVSDEVSALEERTGGDNPFEAFPGPVHLADLDGDGRLDVLVADAATAGTTIPFRYFRRTAAGTFAEPSENPLATIFSKEAGEGPILGRLDLCCGRPFA